MDSWTYDHPPHGTCTPGCPSFGICHCECGQPSKVAVVNRVDHGRVEVAERPRVWLNGHCEKWRKILGVQTGGSYTKVGVSVQPYRKKINWLWKLYGKEPRYGGISSRELAELIHLPYGTINTILYSTQTKKIAPLTAKAIDDFYEQHFRGGRIIRFPTKSEQEEYKRLNSFNPFKEGPKSKVG